MNFFIRLKFALKATLTNLQNISNRKKNLIILTIRLKINIKDHDDVITTLNDCSKNFKNVCRKFFKHRKKNEVQSANDKFKRENKKSKKRKKSFFEIICYTCQEKKHYVSSCFQFSKNAKMKTDVNVVETTKKKVFKKKIRKFSNTINE